MQHHGGCLLLLAAVVLRLAESRVVGGRSVCSSLGLGEYHSNDSNENNDHNDHNAELCHNKTDLTVHRVTSLPGNKVRTTMLTHMQEISKLLKSRCDK